MNLEPDCISQHHINKINNNIFSRIWVLIFASFKLEVKEVRGFGVTVWVSVLIQVSPAESVDLDCGRPPRTDGFKISDGGKFSNGDNLSR